MSVMAMLHQLTLETVFHRLLGPGSCFADELGLSYYFADGSMLRRSYVSYRQFVCPGICLFMPRAEGRATVLINDGSVGSDFCRDGYIRQQSARTCWVEKGCRPGRASS